MKKLLTLVLCVALLMCSCVAAFALTDGAAVLEKESDPQRLEEAAAKIADAFFLAYSGKNSADELSYAIKTAVSDAKDAGETITASWISDLAVKTCDVMRLKYHKTHEDLGIVVRSIPGIFGYGQDISPDGVDIAIIRIVKASIVNECKDMIVAEAE